MNMLLFKTTHSNQFTFLAKVSISLRTGYTCTCTAPLYFCACATSPAGFLVIRKRIVELWITVGCERIRLKASLGTQSNIFHSLGFRKCHGHSWSKKLTSLLEKEAGVRFRIPRVGSLGTYTYLVSVSFMFVCHRLVS